jgi:hypothetical protein
VVIDSPSFGSVVTPTPASSPSTKPLAGAAGGMLKVMLTVTGDDVTEMPEESLAMTVNVSIVSDGRNRGSCAETLVCPAARLKERTDTSLLRKVKLVILNVELAVTDTTTILVGDMTMFVPSVGEAMLTLSCAWTLLTARRAAPIIAAEITLGHLWMKPSAGRLDVLRGKCCRSFTLVRFNILLVGLHICVFIIGFLVSQSSFRLAASLRSIRIHTSFKASETVCWVVTWAGKGNSYMCVKF